jgi:hypothetical protein
VTRVLLAAALTLLAAVGLTALLAVIRSASRAPTVREPCTCLSDAEVRVRFAELVAQWKASER